MGPLTRIRQRAISLALKVDPATDQVVDNRAARSDHDINAFGTVLVMARPHGVLIEGIVIALVILFQGVLGGTALWLGAKVTKDQLDWLPAFLIALLTALVSLIPLPGLITAALGWAVMLTLLYKWSGIDNIWPSGVLLALVARIIQILLGTAVILIFR